MRGRQSVAVRRIPELSTSRHPDNEEDDANRCGYCGTAIAVREERGEEQIAERRYEEKSTGDEEEDGGQTAVCHVWSVLY
jgi:hypothetical protein